MDFTGRQIYDTAVRCDGEVAGVVRDLLLNTMNWSVAYIVVEVGAWPSPRRILLEPAQVSAFVSETRSLDVSLSVRDLEACPLEQTHPPASQQFAVRIAGPPPAALHWADALIPPDGAQRCPDLESARAIRGYAASCGDSRQRVVGLRIHTPDDRFCPVVAAIVVGGLWNWRRTREIPACAVTEVNAEMRRISIAGNS